MNETKQKILDTAERLFGENGYSATSLRHIISEAQVNLAAIHYHFGSKEDLLDQVIMRKAGPMNERRLKLLDQFEAEAAPMPAPIEKVLEAFVSPAIVVEKSPEFVRLMGRVHAEGLLPEIAKRHFQATSARFISALCRALPEVPERELRWKAHFAVGAMAHLLAVRPETMPEGGLETPQNLCRILLSFLSNGFRGPATFETELR